MDIFWNKRVSIHNICHCVSWFMTTILYKVLTRVEIDGNTSDTRVLDRFGPPRG
jgi:hypothetical protein